MSDIRSQARTIWDAVYERVGGDLRAVIRYEPMDSGSVMRDDVRTQYAPDETQAIVDQTIVDQLSNRRQEHAFDAGQLSAVVRVFDEAWIVSCPDSPARKSGVLISIERDGDCASMADVEWCVGYLETECDSLAG
ncbi:hypothetical protein EA462_04755 [Natrarchaeobius halalkaliphilus]|uniref:Uncharacterized protein n=1 Tax=Natrarchaeobius halalkaliphilus TaxID=1679091 RepID=A0A3N6M7I3_9EURY|nr:hypothetical protein [Natrarchaeobius halalkaliphilus]RQG91301.1 hypothetical protein EA462_04755 [Natrarchaeobius halalkaliphilus]